MPKLLISLNNIFKPLVIEQKYYYEEGHLFLEDKENNQCEVIEEDEELLGRLMVLRELGCQFVSQFQGEIELADDLLFYEKLKRATSAKYGERFEAVFTDWVMISHDSTLVEKTEPSQPKTIAYKNDPSLTILSFSHSHLPSNIAHRMALEAHFDIKDEDRSEHFVVDSDTDVLSQAAAEGYQIYQLALLTCSMYYPDGGDILSYITMRLKGFQRTIGLCDSQTKQPLFTIKIANGENYGYIIERLNTMLGCHGVMNLFHANKRVTHINQLGAVEKLTAEIIVGGDEGIDLETPKAKKYLAGPQFARNEYLLLQDVAELPEEEQEEDVVELLEEEQEEDVVELLEEEQEEDVAELPEEEQEEDVVELPEEDVVELLEEEQENHNEGPVLGLGDDALNEADEQVANDDNKVEEKPEAVNIELPAGLSLDINSHHEAIANKVIEYINGLDTVGQVFCLHEAIGLGRGNRTGDDPAWSKLRCRPNNLTFGRTLCYRATNDSEKILRAIKDFLIFNAASIPVENDRDAERIKTMLETVERRNSLKSKDKDSYKQYQEASLKKQDEDVDVVELRVL